MGINCIVEIGYRVLYYRCLLYNTRSLTARVIPFRQ